MRRYISPMSKLLLQVCTAVLALIPIVTGVVTLLGIKDPLYRPLARALWGAVFLGGLGRLLSWMRIGAPPKPFMGFTLLELLGAPAFIYWQARVAGAVGA